MRIEIPAGLLRLSRAIDLLFMLRLAGATAVFQLLCALLHRRQVRAELSAAEPGSLPATTVIVPCKGTGEGMPASLKSMLAQEFPGRLEFVFVAPSRCDPACARVEAALADSPGVRGRLEISQAVPVRCSEKTLNLLHGARRADRGSGVLLFADADIVVASDWARRLVAALEDPSVGLATAVMLYLPQSAAISPLLRLLWVALGLPFYRLFATASGQSMAVRRADFERWRVAELWERCVPEDSAIDAAVRRAGKRIRYVAAAQPVARESCGLPELFGAFNRWLIYARVYDPARWALIAATVLAKTWIILWAVRSAAWGLLALAQAGDMALAWSVLSTLRRLYGLPDYRLRGSLAAPLVLPVYLIGVINSAFAHEVRWGGYTYRLSGPFNIQVRPE